MRPPALPPPLLLLPPPSDERSTLRLLLCRPTAEALSAPSPANSDGHPPGNASAAKFVIDLSDEVTVADICH